MSVCETERIPSVSGLRWSAAVSLGQACWLSASGWKWLAGCLTGWLANWLACWLAVELAVWMADWLSQTFIPLGSPRLEHSLKASDRIGPPLYTHTQVDRHTDRKADRHHRSPTLSRRRHMSTRFPLRLQV